MSTFSNEIGNLVLTTIDIFPTDHKRKRRRWGPRAVFLGLLMLVGSRMRLSYAELMDYLFDNWRDALSWPNRPSISGFSQARNTITVDMCREAWQQAVRYVEARMDPRQDTGLPGRRVICVDGSWVVAPSTAGTRKRWGRIKGKKGNGDTPNPQALVVLGWDLVSRLPIGCSVLDEKEGERVGAHRLIDGFGPGDIVLMDRGFPSDRVLGHLLDRGADFVIRMTTGTARCWKEVRDFKRSGAKDAVVPIEVEDPNGNKRTVMLRLVRRAFDRGRPKKGQTREEMIVVTSLLDHKQHSAKAIIALYKQRWAVETAYREMKVDFRLEEFHSVTPGRIEQELYALLTWLTFSAYLESCAEKALAELRGPQRHDDPERYQINRGQLHHITTWTVTDFLAGGRRWEERLEKLETNIHHLAKDARKRRPNRSSPRVRKRPFGRSRVAK